MSAEDTYSDEKEVDRLKHVFGFHPATQRAQAVHTEVRAHCLNLALWIERNVPPGRERSMALSKVQEAMWAANAATAIGITNEEARQQALSDAMKDI